MQSLWDTVNTPATPHVDTPREAAVREEVRVKIANLKRNTDPEPPPKQKRKRKPDPIQHQPRDHSKDQARYATPPVPHSPIIPDPNDERWELLASGLRTRLPHLSKEECDEIIDALLSARIPGLMIEVDECDLDDTEEEIEAERLRGCARFAAQEQHRELEQAAADNAIAENADHK